MNTQAVLQVLGSYVSLVDIVTPRGAFKGEELLNVGALRQTTLDLIKEIEEETEAEPAETAKESEKLKTPSK